ncbi:PepSY-associated TM helix domain-containing protein [Pseudoteredinibacter isoporae]|uniref:Putative iron-regulated membrane protein n=1 Tax=Pseudoteredinibacter isoporae TaxID=570281 RepID=A0A7X0MYZ8_9GAMM|nr:PepSY-associated TM helix domain-containing protein [Pseudoteredinibacter isoporae]MBB6523624.1 putative iron-regulated membrane protein [Pseudoteredinibacter isoporae]NHO89131.1 PepSY domain-containing protein [Pseudoteredinibacter isoporae]NIB22258.1 PepSY domain-containing protein [Pseudoteredinibacter isoporae]
MKFRQSMNWLHTWSGLVLCWLLYFMFITGSAGYFDHEIDRWMKPEIPVQQGTFDTRSLLPKAEERLQKVATEADQIYIEFPLSRYPFFALWWHNPKDVSTGIKPGWHSELLDPNTGKTIEFRETGGGELLYRMHYILHYIPKSLGHWITSLGAMLMFLALISGIVIHRRIFKDFFSFRRGNEKRAWRDMHNILGVLPLPFYLMITYSGLMLLMFSTMIAIPVAQYGTGPELRSAYDRFFSEPPLREASGIKASNIPLSTMYNSAKEAMGNDPISFINIHHPGDRDAFVEFGTPSKSGLDTFSPVAFDAHNGKPLASEIQHQHTPTQGFYHTMEHLHEGLFAGPLLRWLYFLSGIMGAGMVATGALLWTRKERSDPMKNNGNDKVLTIIERLNVGVIIGLPIAIAAYFWSNRLLPVGISDRANWEANSLFIVWFITLLQPFLNRNKSLNASWTLQLKIASAAYIFIPVLNFASSDNHLFNAVSHGDWVLAGFDIAMLMFGVCFALASLKVPIQKEQNYSLVTSQGSTSP